MRPGCAGCGCSPATPGWDAGQLDDEIARGDWLVVPALPDDVLVSAGADLWGRVLRRQGMPQALLATCPADVTTN